MIKYYIEEMTKKLETVGKACFCYDLDDIVDYVRDYFIGQGYKVEEVVPHCCLEVTR